MKSSGLRKLLQTKLVEGMGFQLKKTLESPLGSKQIKPILHQPWISIRRMDTEAEAPILQSFSATADSLENILMLGKIEGKGKKGEKKIRWLDNIINSMDKNFEKALGIVKDRGAWKGSLQGHKEMDTIFWLNNVQQDNIY